MLQLKDQRKKKNMRLRHVAEKLNVTPQTVWKHERYGVKTVRIARRYAEFYGCDWRELLD